MAIELITKIWCDGHLASEAGNVEGETISFLHKSGKTYEIDLCEDCQKQVPYSDLMDVCEIWGRVKDSQRRKSRAALGEDTVECLFCDKKSPSEQGSKMHMRRSHRAQYAEYLGEEYEDDPIDVITVFTCEDCGKEYTSQSALNGHRNSHRAKQSA